jgi:hypothetical protein
MIWVLVELLEDELLELLMFLAPTIFIIVVTLEIDQYFIH